MVYDLLFTVIIRFLVEFLPEKKHRMSVWINVLGVSACRFKRTRPYIDFGI